jgi:alkaline phosphatase
LSLSTALLLIILCGLLAVVIASRFDRVELKAGDLAFSVHRAPDHDFPAPDASTVSNPGPTRRFHVPASPGPPRNVILVIGDGMGLGHLSMVSTLVHGPAGGLAVESAPVVGLVRTWAANDLVTDSAASSSAMSTGLKTDRKVVARQRDGSDPPTLFEIAADRGMSTGAVTGSGIVDATPAGFLTHAPSRYDFRLIMEQLLESRADVLIGGDHSLHKRAQRQPDYLELVRDLEAMAPDRWTVVRDADRLEGSSGPLLAVFGPRNDGTEAYGPPLARSAAVAINLLADNPAGFLLLLENEETDEGAHDNNLDRVVNGLQELDAMVAEVLDFASRRGDTLVLITADHDTGAPAIVEGDFGRGRASVRWLGDEHTPTWVPLFAFGPGAERFAGVYDNTEIRDRIAELLGFDQPPSNLGDPDAV